MFVLTHVLRVELGTAGLEAHFQQQIRATHMILSTSPPYQALLDQLLMVPVAEQPYASLPQFLFPSTALFSLMARAAVLLGAVLDLGDQYG